MNVKAHLTRRSKSLLTVAGRRKSAAPFTLVVRGYQVSANRTDDELGGQIGYDRATHGFSRFDLEAKGERAVKDELNSGKYGHEGLPVFGFVSAWLKDAEFARLSSDSANRNAREEETLSIAREALSTAKAASFAATAAAASASDANKIATSALDTSRENLQTSKKSMAAAVVAAIAAIAAAYAAIKGIK